MGRAYDAVVAGHICLDVIPDLPVGAQRDGEMLLRPGHLTEAGPLVFATGGAVSNTGLALHKLGISTQLMGKVGDDLLGQAVRERIVSYGPHLAEGMVIDRTVNTSYTIIINPPGVDRIFLHCPGANDTFSADDVRYDVVAGARVFHFGYPPLMKRMFQDNGAQLLQIFRRVAEMGVTTSLDTALPDPTSAAGRANWGVILRAVLPYVDIFLPSIEESLYMLRRRTFEEFCLATGSDGFLASITPSLLSDLSRDLLEMGATIVGFKLGDRGLYVRTAAQPSIEAIGAARPSNPAVWANRALTTAVAVGACNVEAADALSGVRPWEEMWLRVKEGWARHALALDVPGWYLNDAHLLWVGPADEGAVH